MAARNWGFDGVLKNSEDFLHLAFPGLWLRHSETPPASSIILVLHCGNADKLLFCVCGGDSVLDINMKHCREQPLTLFFVCFFPLLSFVECGLPLPLLSLCPWPLYGLCFAALLLLALIPQPCPAAALGGGGQPRMGADPPAVLLQELMSVRNGLPSCPELVWTWGHRAEDSLAILAAPGGWPRNQCFPVSLFPSCALLTLSLCLDPCSILLPVLLVVGGFEMVFR